MHIINYNSTGESSFKIYITTNSSYIIFNNTNYNNITFNLDTPLTIGDERLLFIHDKILTEINYLCMIDNLKNNLPI